MKVTDGLGSISARAKSAGLSCSSGLLRRKNFFISNLRARTRGATSAITAIYSRKLSVHNPHGDAFGMSPLSGPLTGTSSKLNYPTIEQFEGEPSRLRHQAITRSEEEPCLSTTM
jgi:hypothetical protein